MISTGSVRVEAHENTELLARRHFFLIIIDEFLVRWCVFTVSVGPPIGTITHSSHFLDFFLSV